MIAAGDVFDLCGVDAAVEDVDGPVLVPRDGNIQPDIYALSELLVQLCEETRAAMEEKNKAQSEKLRKYTAKYQK